VIKSLTKDERRAWQLGTEDIATNARGFVSAEVLAMNRQRYEKTLQALDVQIEALVMALRAYMNWEPATTVAGDYRTLMFRAAELAIKEATHE